MAFCPICGFEMVKEPRVQGDPAVDCGHECVGCVAKATDMPRGVISRDAYPDIDDVLAEVYGGTTVLLPSMPNRVNAADLLPLHETADGTPL